jgi:hypothetical protein
LACIKYSIVSPRILYYLSILTSSNQILFDKEDLENKEDLKRKEDSNEDFKDVYVEKLIPLKILVNKKNLVFKIGKLIYESTKLERSVDLRNFDKNK